MADPVDVKKGDQNSAKLCLSHPFGRIMWIDQWAVDQDPVFDHIGQNWEDSNTVRGYVVHAVRVVEAGPGRRSRAPPRRCGGSSRPLRRASAPWEYGSNSRSGVLSSGTNPLGRVPTA